MALYHSATKQEHLAALSRARTLEPTGNPAQTHSICTQMLLDTHYQPLTTLVPVGRMAVPFPD